MADTDSDWPDRLLHDLARAPLLDDSLELVPKHYATVSRNELSERELQILHCASIGLTTEHIADLLFLAQTTVKDHLKRARYVLRAKNTTHACCLAIRQGLFE
jgi:DNA-binding NarL/FixJ family response regulator